MTGATLTGATLTGATLVVVDMQEIFRVPSSPWATVGYDDAAANVARLVDAHDGPVVWTRFVRDPHETGSWGPYYDRWSQCRLEPGSAQWDITLPVVSGAHTLTLPTFSKWGSELAGLSAGADDLVVCGVATDCCVLSTVLGAVDAGKRVTVVSDACAGATAAAHEQALALMDLLAPMTSVRTTDAVLQEAAAS